MSKGVTTGTLSSAQPTAYGSGRFVPPQPMPGYDGEIQEGISRKFDTKLRVVDHDGKQPLGEVSKYDVAQLQLSLQECLELIKRKDVNLENHHDEISALGRRAQDYLIMQDHLYTDYVRAEKERDR